MNSRRIVKRLMQPLLRQVYPRIDHRIRREMAPLEENIPTLLNVISSQNAASRAHARALEQQERRLAELDERLRRVEAIASAQQTAAPPAGVADHPS